LESALNLSIRFPSLEISIGNDTDQVNALKVPYSQHLPVAAGNTWHTWTQPPSISYKYLVM